MRLMQYGTIIILNGASSSGKTSILRALQAVLAEPYLEAGIDKFIWMLPPAYLERPLWDDVLGLADHAGVMGHRLVTGMHHAIMALSKTGINVIADHVLVELQWLQDCASLFSDLPAYLIGVRCPLEVLQQRELDRKTRTLGQAAAQHLLVHQPGIYDLQVDTSVLSAHACALQIKVYIENGNPPRALKIIKSDYPPYLSIS